MTTSVATPSDGHLDRRTATPSGFAAGLHCPRCGYDLRGIPEDRCPECGFRYEHAAIRMIVADGEEYRLAAYRRVVRLTGAVLGCLSLVACEKLMPGDRGCPLSSVLLVICLIQFSIPCLLALIAWAIFWVEIAWWKLAPILLLPAAIAVATTLAEVLLVVAGSVVALQIVMLCTTGEPSRYAARSRPVESRLRLRRRALVTWLWVLSSGCLVVLARSLLV